jgi:hypothetical protein
MLPLSSIYYRQQERQPAYTERFALRRLATCGVIILSLFAFTATQRVGDRMVSEEKQYEFKMSKGVLIKELQRVGGYLHHYRYDDEFVRRLEKINKRPMTEEDRNSYSLNTISKFCDSTVHATFTLHTVGDKTVLKVGHLLYNCKAGDEQHDMEATRTFEREVIERLGGRPVESWPGLEEP